jgi:hypothetical protein
MNYANTQQTIYQLMNIHQLLSKPENWCQSEDPDGKAVTLCEAFNVVGVNEKGFTHNLDKDDVYPGDLKRGEIPEPVWFIRQALNKIAPEFGGLIYKWEDMVGRTHKDVLDLVNAALDLARTELLQILDTNEGFDTSGLVLHRWADRDGHQLCAMSALSKKLGYEDLTDIPKEVDPGLAALVNLLNDRANDKARQLLISRLKYLPNTGRTDLCLLIGKVFFPMMIEGYGYKKEADLIVDCKSPRALSRVHASLGTRFLNPDGIGLIASGCIAISAALKTNDPVKRDLLAVSAASQLVSFEIGFGWVDLLYILDSILGLEDSPCVGSEQSFARYGKYFAENKPYSEEIKAPSLISNKGNGSTTEIYDFGIKVQWFPALVEKFPDRLEEIAEKILDEVAVLESVTIYMHRFPFEDEEVMIVTSWDDDLDMLFADADLVAYQDVIGEADIDGDGKVETVLMPVPASDGGYIH